MEYAKKMKRRKTNRVCSACWSLGFSLTQLDIKSLFIIQYISKMLHKRPSLLPGRVPWRALCTYRASRSTTRKNIRYHIRKSTHRHCGFWPGLKLKIPLHACWFVFPVGFLFCHWFRLCFWTYTRFPIAIVLPRHRSCVAFFCLLRAVSFMLCPANSTHLLCIWHFMFYPAIKCIRRVSHSIGIVSSRYPREKERANATGRALVSISNCVSNPFRDSWIYSLLTIRRRIERKKTTSQESQSHWERSHSNTYSNAYYWNREREKKNVPQIKL